MKKLLTLCFALALGVLTAQVAPAFVYESEDLKIREIDKNVFIHLSYLNTDDYGRVGCNGAIFFDEDEAIVFDTPTNDAVSEELLQWIEQEQKKRVKALVVTHFHEDCLGGLQAFHNRKVRSYANAKTISILKSEGESPWPEVGFEKEMEVNIGQEKILLKYYGAGHTTDNIVGYIPSKEVLFGGCLIKKVDASKGYLGDANVKDWSNTVSKIRKDLPALRFVIPGHGRHGGTELLDYTIDLFKE